MASKDESIKLLAGILSKSIEAISKLIDANTGDKSALEAANAKIAELESAAAGVDAATSESITDLSMVLSALADKALSVPPVPVPPEPTPL